MFLSDSGSFYEQINNPEKKAPFGVDVRIVLTFLLLRTTFRVESCLRKIIRKYFPIAFNQ